jgi:hypothetical protein
MLDRGNNLQAACCASQQALLLVDVTHELGELVIAAHQPLAKGGSALQVPHTGIWSLLMCLWQHTQTTLLRPFLLGVAADRQDGRVLQLLLPLPA